MPLHCKGISIESRKFWSKYGQSNIFLTYVNYSCLKRNYQKIRSKNTFSVKSDFPNHSSVSNINSL